MTGFAATTEAHLAELARTMRAADAAECRALGLSPEAALRASLRASDFSTTLLRGGSVVAVAGLTLEPAAALGRRVAQAWVLTSSQVDAAPHGFHRAAKAWLCQALQVADVLWAMVDARYEASLRWLGALGFEVYPPRPWGPLGALFHFVVKEA